MIERKEYTYSISEVELLEKFLDLILKRGSQVYTQVIDDTKSATLVPIIREKKGQTALDIQIVIALTMP